MNKVKKAVLGCLVVSGVFSLAYFITAGVNHSDAKNPVEDNVKVEVCTVATTDEIKKVTEKQTEAVTQSTTATTTTTTTATQTTKPVTEAKSNTSAKTTKKATVEVPSDKFDYAYFSDSAFIGNSRLVGLSNFGLCKNVFSKVNLNVKTVFTEKDQNGTVIIENLNKGVKYKNIFVMFGDNEAGYEDTAFISGYKSVIEKIKKYQPESKIYVISILPISKERSDKNVYGYNINRIKQMNNMIKKMCDSENIIYLDVAECMVGSDGYLPSSASTDGAHFGKNYYCMMLNYIMSVIGIQ